MTNVRDVRTATWVATAVMLAGCTRQLPPGPPAPAMPANACPVPAVPSCAVEFRFGVGDNLEVSVWREADLTSVQRVLPDGTICPPLLDPLPIAGDSVQQVRRKLTERYSEYLKSPVVSLRVMEIHSLRVAVLGEVRSPTVITVDGPTTVIEAIARAGGFNEGTADLCTIRIVRPNPAGGPPLVYSSDVTGTLSGRLSHVILAPGDVVFVHPTSLAQWSRNLKLAFEPVGALLGPIGNAAATILAVESLVD